MLLSTHEETLEVYFDSAEIFPQCLPSLFPYLPYFETFPLASILSVVKLKTYHLQKTFIVRDRADEYHPDRLLSKNPGTAKIYNPSNEQVNGI